MIVEPEHRHVSSSEKRKHRSEREAPLSDRAFSMVESKNRWLMRLARDFRVVACRLKVPGVAFDLRFDQAGE